MVFRRLYWITEQTNRQGAWRATGVYTSTHDLVEHGVRWVGDDGPGCSFRIALVKLDCAKDVLRCWTGPEFVGLEEGLESYVQTGEFTAEDAVSLRSALDGFCGVPER